ncbi:ABC transporter ATP-binding protein [Flavihumibacter sp. UBA7668]|uniref:ATP-binding cassette domain-containing protein n=1 Tax=Flavihumibacter sp. UBA7668 TaxID=1946542 RepID=UPI0025BCC809|nr:ABC transporter ATP-binding protein [Flavihumibacter sp. UBA7668]
MQEPIVEVKEITAIAGDQTILYPISLSLQAGHRLAIAGETGSGKSTLLKSMAGLQNLSGGAVYWKGRRVEEPWEKLVPGHPYIAYLSQHFELRNNYRVEEILSYAEKITGEAAAEVYRLCQVNHLLKRKTDQLSGGERQRIAMARLLVGAPTIFLLDEPFSNLDALHKQTMKEVMRDLGNAMHITWVLVSHDPGDLLSWADELLILKEGRRVQQGNPLELFFNPVDAYCAGLLGPYSVLGNKILRPTDFELVPVENGVLSGTVLGIEFIGYGYLLSVILNDGQIVQLFHSETVPLQKAVGIQLR